MQLYLTCGMSVPYAHLVENRSQSLRVLVQDVSVVWQYNRFFNSSQHVTSFHQTSGHSDNDSVKKVQLFIIFGTMMYGIAVGLTHN